MATARLLLGIFSFAFTGSFGMFNSYLLIQDKGKVAVNLSQKNKEIADEKKKVKTSSYSWKLILTGLGVILIIGWVLYRKVF